MENLQKSLSYTSLLDWGTYLHPSQKSLSNKYWAIIWRQYRPSAHRNGTGPWNWCYMFQGTRVGVQLCTHFCLSMYILKGSVQEYVHMDLMSIMWAEIYFAFPSGEVQSKRLVHLVQSRLWTRKNRTILTMHSNQNVLKYTALFLTSFIQEAHKACINLCRTGLKNVSTNI